MENLKKYFTNLLILQYKNKPKAKATIEALVTAMFSDTNGNIFPTQIQNAYNLDTAIGKQLDVIGKYVGYDRVLPIPIDNTFKYAEYDGSINPSEGYSEYTESKKTYPYAEYRYSSYQYYNISDETYRKILKMIISLKNKPLSLGFIDQAISVFDNKIYVVENDKNLEYHISSDLYEVLNNQDSLNVFFNKYFPRPMGCSLTVVRD